MTAIEVSGRCDVDRWFREGHRRAGHRVFFGGLDVTDRCVDLETGMIDGFVTLVILGKNGELCLDPDAEPPDVLKETLFGPVEVAG